ncbi:MAG: carboxylesterase family protein [Treponema sp.]|nr:carboxylesterase family protein [Treponema sp.]
MRYFRFYTIVFFALFLVSCSSSSIKNQTQPFPGIETLPTEVIELEKGKIQGIQLTDKSLELFAGIPFAKAPVGDLRWKEPQDLEAWDDIYYADHFAPMAMQNQTPKIIRKLMNAYVHSKGDRTDFAPMSEDCLYLNIWRPKGLDSTSKLPVLVYVHGGSLSSGSSWFQSYDGASLAQKDLIFVTISYRLNIFGYFASQELAEESPNGTTGNYGLLDQIKALEWVNKNIKEFGGDPENITIAGESAGSSSVNALCASPLSKGMFKRAIAESSSLVVPVPAHTFRSRELALSTGQKIMDELGAKNLADMRNLSAQELMKTTHVNNSMTVDPYSMPEYPWEIYQKGLNHEEALLNGFNKREGDAFIVLSKITKKNYRDLVADSPYVTDVDGLCSLAEPVKNNKEAKKFYGRLFSAICFTYPHDSWTKVLESQGKPVYEYYFSKENKGIGTYHSGEMIYAYGNVPKTKAYNQSDYELEEIMSEYWANFAKYGNPNGLGESNLPLWQTSKESNGLLLELGEEIYMREDPFKEIYQYLDFDIGAENRPATFGRSED